MSFEKKKFTGRNPQQKNKGERRILDIGGSEAVKSWGKKGVLQRGGSRDGDRKSSGKSGETKKKP